MADSHRIKYWVLAARPKTLLAAIAPVITGAALAFRFDKFNLIASLVAMLCSILIQVGTNFINDLYDFLKGSDTPDRKGPTRALSNNLISESQMKLAIKVVFISAFLLGLVLVKIGGWIILLIGIASLLSGYAYTAGPLPLAYNGLGDIFVFIFFGIVATVGTYYVNALEFSYTALMASIPVGALITNILVVNNYRDVEEDRRNNKKTLAVLFGLNFTRLQFISGMLVSYIVLVPIYIYYLNSLYVFLPLLSLPVAIRLVYMIYKYSGEKLNITLELSAKFSMIYGLLFSLGIIL